MRQKENAEKRSRGVLIFIIVVVSLSAGAEAPGVREHRVSAWSAAMHTPLPFPGVPPLPVFENQTIRRHPSATGYKGDGERGRPHDVEAGADIEYEEITS